jgi:hypothetical protein
MRPVAKISEQTHVRAVFADNVTFFDLPAAVTLEDLSERIARLGEHHVGAPISIHVRKSDRAAWVPWPLPANGTQRGEAGSR